MTFNPFARLALAIVSAVLILTGLVFVFVYPASVELDETGPVRIPDAQTTTSTTGLTTTSAPTPPGPVTTVAAPPDPAALAATCTDTERTIRNPETSEADLSQSAPAQQRAYRTISIHPAILPDVLNRVPADIRETVRANAEATIELRRLTKPAKALPAWQIVTPPPAAELMSYYRQAEAEFGVPWAYMAAIHLVETRMGRIRGTSTAGAQGPMQFLPATWDAYGEGDINSARDSIRAAARYLKRSGAPERIADALFAYNRSDRYVKAVQLHAWTMLTDESERPNFDQVPFAYRGYHQWQVWYRLPDGDVLLPEGWTGA